MIAVDGNSIDGSLSLVAQVRERSVGDNVTLTALRDGQGEDINVIFGAKATTCQQRRGLEPDTLPARLVGSGAGAVTLMRSVSNPRPSNRACGSPAHGSPTPFTGGVRPEPARPGWAWVRRRFH
jgi:hypothetical protein